MMKKLKSPLLKVRIQLYENKKDYAEAFIQHLNHIQHKKNIFQWIYEKFVELQKLEFEFNEAMNPDFNKD